MSGWLLLVGAIVAEVCGTLCLKVASDGARRWYLVMGVAYLAAFTMLGSALGQGIPLGVAYGTWAAVGVALTALGSRIFFGEAMSRLMVFGIGLIMVGVVLVEVGSTH